MNGDNEEQNRVHPGFFALDPRYADPQRATAMILPVPFDATSTWKKGADRGPEAMLEASTMVELYDIETRSEPYLRGIATLPPVEVDVSAEQLALRVQARVAEILENGRLPVVVGGEHSVTIGAVNAAADVYPDLSVLQIDAHADTREVFEGSTHNHGCVMARARERCPIVQVGIRSLAASEMVHIDETRIFWAHEIAAARHLQSSCNDVSVEGTRWGWMDDAVDLLTNDVYVTIDLDGLDPGFVPATGFAPSTLSNCCQLWETMLALSRRLNSCIASWR